jgi:recombination protein RecT
MASKTVLKLLLSKFAPLSVEMQTAVLTDQAVIINADTTDVMYPDNTDQVPVDKEKERIRLMIEDANKLEHLEAIAALVEADQIDMFNAKKELIISKLKPSR